MSVRTPFCLAALALGTASAHAAPQRVEHLTSPPLSGYVTAHAAGNAVQSIREEIPASETLADWTRMVTTQRFGGLATRTTPAQYVSNILAAVPARCPDADVSPVRSQTISGRPAARFQLSCPRGTGGKAESFILLAIAGNQDMHVKQVAFRGPVGSADHDWAQRFLNATVFCSVSDRSEPCR